jgi:hypothetical protein
MQHGYLRHKEGLRPLPDAMVELSFDGVHADSVGRRVDPPPTRWPQTISLGRFLI